MSATPSFPRAGIAAADPADASALGPVIVAPAQSIRLGAASDTPGTTITLSVYFLDAGMAPVCVERLQFTAPAAADWGKSCVGTPAVDPCWPLSGCKAVVVHVDYLSGGTWSIDGTTA